MSDDPRLVAMRELVTEQYGKGDPRQQPIVAHEVDSADYARRLIDRIGECSDGALVEDWHIAATGRDLYFDTALQPDELRSRFGDRVERMIAGLSDRVEQSGYAAFVASFAEELAIIRLSSVVDNIATCAKRIDVLDLRWVRNTFAPMVKNGLPIWTSPRFVRYPKTGAIVVRAVEHEHGLLVDAIAEAARLEASDAAPTRPPLKSAEILVRNEEREYREGWLLRGMRVLFTLE